MTSHRFSLIVRAAVVAGALISTAACNDDVTAPRPARVPSGISAVDNPDLVKNATDAARRRSDHGKPGSTQR